MSATENAQGRPTVYTEELADTILSRMENGEALRWICRDESMPDERTVRRWATDNREGFSPRYARAREMQAARWAEEILEIADDGTGDTWRDDEGNVHTNYDVIQRSKLRVDTRRWLLSKLLPKQFGDKLEISGSEESPLVTRITFVKPEDAPDG